METYTRRENQQVFFENWLKTSLRCGWVTTRGRAHPIMLGGVLTFEGSIGMCCHHDPLFRPLFLPWIPTLSNPSLALETLLIVFEKKCIFQAHILSCFGDILAPKTVILQKNCSQDLSFKPKNLFHRPYFENLCGTYLTKNHLSTLPGSHVPIKCISMFFWERTFRKEEIQLGFAWIEDHETIYY